MAEYREQTGKCGAQTRGGSRCGKAAGWGTEHVGIGPCKLHGGTTPTVVKGAQVVMAKQAVETYGLPVATTPQQALEDELARTAGHVAWLGQVVQQLEEAELTGPVGTSGVDAKTGLRHHAQAEPSVWVRMYQAERKHLADVAATCLRVGLEAKRVELAQQQGQLIAQVLQAVLTDLKVPLEQARPVVRKHLTAIAGGAG